MVFAASGCLAELIQQFFLPCDGGGARDRETLVFGDFLQEEGDWWGVVGFGSVFLEVEVGLYNEARR